MSFPIAQKSIYSPAEKLPCYGQPYSFATLIKLPRKCSSWKPWKAMNGKSVNPGVDLSGLSATDGHSKKSAPHVLTIIHKTI